MISRISARLIKISDRNKFQFLSLSFSLLIRILILTVNKDFFLSFSFLSFFLFWEFEIICDQPISPLADRVPSPLFMRFLRRSAA